MLRRRRFPLWALIMFGLFASTPLQTHATTVCGNSGWYVIHDFTKSDENWHTREVDEGTFVQGQGWVSNAATIGAVSQRVVIQYPSQATQITRIRAEIDYTAGSPGVNDKRQALMRYGSGSYQMLATTTGTPPSSTIMLDTGSINITDLSVLEINVWASGQEATDGQAIIKRVVIQGFGYQPDGTCSMVEDCESTWTVIDDFRQPDYTWNVRDTGEGQYIPGSGWAATNATINAISKRVVIQRKIYAEDIDRITIRVHYTPGSGPDVNKQILLYDPVQSQVLVAAATPLQAQTYELVWNNEDPLTGFPIIQDWHDRLLQINVWASNLNQTDGEATIESIIFEGSGPNPDGFCETHLTEAEILTKDITNTPEGVIERNDAIDRWYNTYGLTIDPDDVRVYDVGPVPMADVIATTKGLAPTFIWSNYTITPFGRLHFTAGAEYRIIMETRPDPTDPTIAQDWDEHLTNGCFARRTVPTGQPSSLADGGWMEQCSDIHWLKQDGTAIRDYYALAQQLEFGTDNEIYTAIEASLGSMPDMDSVTQYKTAEGFPSRPANEPECWQAEGNVVINVIKYLVPSFTAGRQFCDQIVPIPTEEDGSAMLKWYGHAQNQSRFMASLIGVATDPTPQPPANPGLIGWRVLSSLTIEQ